MVNKKKNVVVDVSHISKDFHLPHEKNSSVKGSLVNIFRKNNKSTETQHVLKDISFSVEEGEFFGILGRNGSGKSTLLKMISQIYTPTKGEVSVKGKLVPFIELGVGFNPELTGRENVYLNGALLGFSRKEIDDRYDDIVSFAELEDFMDQKLKNYSSGMQVRLAFSVAIRADADILVLDEILAVGDANFQRKCNDYFERIRYEKKTVILVTHSMDAVEKYCSRAMLINDGRIVKIGDATSVAQEYSNINTSRNKRTEGDEELIDERNVNLRLYAQFKDEVINSVDVNKVNRLKFTVEIRSPEDIHKAVLGFTVFNGAGIPIFATNTKQTKDIINIKKGEPAKVSFELDNIFSNGDYILSASLKDENQTVTYASHRNEEVVSFFGRRHDFAAVSPSYEITIT